MTADLISKARAGDHGAFRELTDPYRRALQLHCYRMLGSYHDAEEILQDTLLAAWRGLGEKNRAANDFLKAAELSETSSPAFSARAREMAFGKN